jgi:catalase
MILSRNLDNYFAEIEQSAFSPANVVPSIEFSPDKMLHARLFAYADADRHRPGINYTSIAVNSLRNVVINNYYRDGLMTVTDNGKGLPSYEPNNFEGPWRRPHF